MCRLARGPPSKKSIASAEKESAGRRGVRTCNWLIFVLIEKYTASSVTPGYHSISGVLTFDSAVRFPFTWPTFQIKLKFYSNYSVKYEFRMIPFPATSLYTVLFHIIDHVSFTTN
ncbi:hypothetical protein GWI33_009507 [Rhynchophorus ferrugineus]|uniref:Uncharacterized protein n=1 Tax=Rhynchophorus ferrugineus TaxID=354439 RepID=A0A834I9M2_RHYFE|nr:hypothetical protein GWI33_009507 [Rhynchophorus ferrugineus]